MEAGESEYSGLLKTRKLLILRGAKNAEYAEIAANWNESGTRGLGQRSQFLVREKGMSARFLAARRFAIISGLPTNQGLARITFRRRNFRYTGSQSDRPSHPCYPSLRNAK